MKVFLSILLGAGILVLVAIVWVRVYVLLAKFFPVLAEYKPPVFLFWPFWLALFLGVLIFFFGICYELGNTVIGAFQ